MLVIATKFSETMLRPKYTPRNIWPDKVVIDSETKKTIYGPETRDACQRFIDECPK